MHLYCWLLIHCYVEKTQQHVAGALLDYGRVKWQRTLKVIEKALDVAYDDVLKVFDNVWCVKGLIAIGSNLGGPKINIFTCGSLNGFFPTVVCTLVTFCD